MKTNTSTSHAIGIIVSGLILVVIAFVLAQTQAHNVSAAPNSGNDDPVSKYQVSTSVWVGKDIATTVAAAQPGRTYLEISNISGATSTPTGVYCAVGATPVLYQGVFINASSTRIWGRMDSVPVGAVKCLSANASSTVTVVAK